MLVTLMVTDGWAEAKEKFARLLGRRGDVEAVAGELESARTELTGEPGCLVIVTSRMRLNGPDDAHRLELGPLPMSDTVALLRAAGGIDVGVDEEAPVWPAGLCGRLPLARRIAGALISTGDQSPRQLAGSLQSERARLQLLDDDDPQRNLSALFTLSYRALSPELQLLLRRLGLHPGPDIDSYAAAALLDGVPATARRLLQRLADHSLPDRRAPGRYRLHDLIRAYARTLADTDSEPERTAALDRLLYYYAHTAQTASQAIAHYPRPVPDSQAPAFTPVLRDAGAARTWLRVEYLNLDTVFTHAYADGLSVHAIALASGLAEILLSDGPWSRALEVHQAAVEAAEHPRPSAAAHATALSDLGRVWEGTGDYPGAETAHTQALELFHVLGHHANEAVVLNYYAAALASTGQRLRARALYQQALAVHRELYKPDDEAISLEGIGEHYVSTGEHAQGVLHLHQALEIYQRLGMCADIERVQAHLASVPPQ